MWGSWTIFICRKSQFNNILGHWSARHSENLYYKTTTKCIIHSSQKHKAFRLGAKHQIFNFQVLLRKSLSASQNIFPSNWSSRFVSTFKSSFFLSILAQVRCNMAHVIKSVPLQNVMKAKQNSTTLHQPKERHAFVVTLNLFFWPALLVRLPRAGSGEDIPGLQGKSQRNPHHTLSGCLLILARSLQPAQDFCTTACRKKGILFKSV